MRELKFRAWNRQAKEMMYSDGDFHISYEECWLHFAQDIKNPRDKNIHGGYDIQQFTGLLDKNGKEIYEGDIVRCHRLCDAEKHRKNIGFDPQKFPWPENHWYDCIEIGEIQWSDISMGFVENYDRIRYDDIWPLSCGTEHRYEVVGNIFENPELLNATQS